MAKALLVATDPLGEPGGNGVRLRQHVKFLSEWFDVHVISVIFKDQASEDRVTAPKNCTYEVVRISKIAGIVRTVGAGALAPSKPLQVAFYDSRVAKQRLTERLEEMRDLALVVAHLYRAAGLLASIKQDVSSAGQMCSIIDAQDCLSVRFATRAEHGDSMLKVLLWREEARRLRHFEDRNFSAFDATLFTTGRDAGQCKNGGNIVSNCVDLKCQMIDEDRSTDTVRDIIFVADFTAKLAVWGAKRLVYDIMPKVWRKHPNVTVRLVGARPGPEVEKMAGDRVVVTGFVDDITLEYQRADVAVYPLKFGSGVKNKVLEAMACGIPVITNEVGNQGIDAQDNQEIILCDSIFDYQESIEAMVESPRKARRIGRQGRELVQKRFSPARVREQYRSILNNLGL